MISTQSKLGFSLLGIIFLLTIPYLYSFFFNSCTSTASTLPDTVFKPNFNNSQLEHSRKRMQDSVELLLRQRGSSCSDYDLDKCKNRTVLLANAIFKNSKKYQGCRQELKDYKGKWQNICQRWKRQKDDGSNQNSRLQQEAIKSGLMINQLNNEIKELNGRLATCNTECPICKKCEDCNCAKPDACPICHPSSTDYSILFRQHQKLNKNLKQSQEQHDSCRHNNKECKYIGDAIAKRLKEGVLSFESNVQATKFNIDTQDNLSKLIRGVDHRRFGSAEDSIKVVGGLVGGVKEELMRLKEATDLRRLLVQCRDGYLQVTKYLNICEKQLQPFRRK